mgnify:CR=1 FL=1
MINADDHLPIAVKPANSIISGGRIPVMNPTKNSIKLTKTDDSFAFVKVPKKSPIAKINKQINK